jgi:AcrR family transcriptional regulator
MRFLSRAVLSCETMDHMKAPSIRARVRAEMIEEIKTIARQHLASEGANLSLRAVARDLGLVSSAIYRYFPSRDDLLTALIVDAYNALGDTIERADATQNRADLKGRWLAVTHAIRDWALARPHEYALIYGSPVPGYNAPQDTVGPATRSTFALGRILTDGVELGLLPATGEPLAQPVHEELQALREAAFPAVPESLLARGMAGWILTFGAVSFELFGQFQTILHDRRAFFDLQVRAAYDQITAAPAPRS